MHMIMWLCKLCGMALKITVTEILSEAALRSESNYALKNKGAFRFLHEAYEYLVHGMQSTFRFFNTLYAI